jgi:hypothetical protein
MIRYARLNDANEVIGELDYADHPDVDDIRKLSNGLPCVRPLVVNTPTPAWNEQIAGFNYVVHSDRIEQNYYVASRPMSTLKAEVLARLSSRFNNVLSAGMAYAGKVLQIREVDQQNIVTMGNEARWALATSTPWPAMFAWRMADDTFLALPTANSMIALAEAAKTEVLRLRQNKWRLADLIAAATTVEDLDAIDINTGW